MNDSGRERARYVRRLYGERDEVLQSILEYGLRELRLPTIQIDDNTGRIIQFLCRLVQPKVALEIGSLFGYSSVYLARGLTDGGKLICLENNSECARATTRNLETAGLKEKAEVCEVDALEYLRSLEDESVDLVFIDGSKRHYPDYLSSAFKKLRSNGILIADDAYADQLFTGDSTEERDNSLELDGIHKYNSAIVKSTQFWSAFVPTENGLLIAIKS